MVGGDNVRPDDALNVISASKAASSRASSSSRSGDGPSAALKRGSASRSSGQWRDDDYDVLEDGVVVSRIFVTPAAPQDRQWMWARGHSAATVKRAAHGYEPTREAAMAAFAKRVGDLAPPRRWHSDARLEMRWRGLHRMEERACVRRQLLLNKRKQEKNLFRNVRFFTFLVPP